MQTATIKVNLYNFSELAGKQSKEKAKSELTLDLADIIKFEISEHIKERLINAGLTGLTQDIAYSLTGAQGDGVAFYGKVNLKEFMQKQNIVTENEIPDMFVSVYHTQSYGKYNHYGTMSITSDIEFYEIPKKIIKESKQILNKLDMKIKAISLQLEKECYLIIENIESDEYINQYCMENELKFLKNGTLFVLEAFYEVV